MPASHIRIDAAHGLPDIHCPACGAAVLTAEYGPAEELCDHVCFFINADGEITLADPESYLGEANQRQQGLVDLIEITDDWDAFIVQAASALTNAVIVLDYNCAAGDDDEGIRVVVAFDLLTGYGS